jgi:hypothetical protein
MLNAKHKPLAKTLLVSRLALLAPQQAWLHSAGRLTPP